MSTILPQIIYVVVSQRDDLTGTKSIPIAAFSDYPAALTYAISIFKQTYTSQLTSKDLVFMINLTPSIVAAVTGL